MLCRWCMIMLNEAHTHPWFSGHVWFSFPIWGHHFAGAGEVIGCPKRPAWGWSKITKPSGRHFLKRKKRYGVPLLQWNMLILYLYLSSFLAKLCGDSFSVTFYLGWRSCATGLSENSSRDFLSMDCTKILVPRILHRSGFLCFSAQNKSLSEASKCLTHRFTRGVFSLFYLGMIPAPLTSSGQNLTPDHPPCLRSMDWLECCTGSPK